MSNIPPAIARALAPFTPPEPEPWQIGWSRSRQARYDEISASLGGGFGFDHHETVMRILGPPIAPSLVVDCPACDGGWRDTPTGTVMCGQCGGTGRRGTNGGEV